MVELYCDYRVGGIPRWVIGVPSELTMRFPDHFLKAPVFLCVDTGGEQFRMVGTAFVLSVNDPISLYLVTARHCVEKARQYGNLYVRFNKVRGGSEVIELRQEWYSPESDADDVAVLPLPITVFPTFDIVPFLIPVWILTEQNVQGEGIGIGIGDDLVSLGLFTHRDGKHENHPIMRSGIIAAMPDEPLEDPNSGLEYDAYLAEIRSIGGLSGSPVFVVLPPDRMRKVSEESYRAYFLLGLMRGHWPKDPQEFADFGESEQEQINTGIAIVTPIEKAVDIIMNTEELVRERRRLAREYATLLAPVDDSGEDTSEVRDGQGDKPNR
jgi:hypothetical protein